MILNPIASQTPQSEMQNERCRQTDEQLLTQTRRHAKEYLSATRRVLDDIYEVDKRKLWAAIGFGSLFEYLQKDLGFCNATADRKLKAVRMMRSVPEVADRIESGAVTLTAVANLQRAIEQEERRSKMKIEQPRKLDLLARIEKQSTPQVERLLAIEFPELPKKQESLRAITDKLSRLSIVLTDDQIQKLNKVRDLTSHSNFSASLADLIEKMADEFIKRHDPMEKKLRAIKTEASSATDVKPSIATLRNRVFQLDGQRCSFKDHRSGKTCGSTFQLEIDHIMPKALGGKDELENLRVYCRAHNQFAAQQTFGKQNGHPKAAVL